MDERVPEIRFKGFEGPWELKKLGEIADIVGGGTPSTGIPEYWSGNISWYSPAEIGNKVFVSESQRKITKAGYNHCSANILPPGTVLFTSRAGIGKTAILEKEGCTNQGFQSIIPHKEQLDSYFIYSRSAELKQYGETVGAGSTFVEVSGKQMADMDILIPTVFEQRVIGGYFRNLDNSIFFTQQKLDQLKTLKKTCLEKMFPKEGETVPEIRLKGFSEDWETKKISDVCSLSKESIDPRSFSEKYFFEYSMSAYDNGLVPDYVLGSSMNSTRIKVTSECILFNKLNVRKERIWYIKNPKPMSVCSGEFLPLCSTDIYLPFLTQILKSKETTKAMESVSTGSSNSQKRIQPYSLMNYTVMIPKQKQEQRLLGDYFRKIDILISLQQQKMDKLKVLKKAFLDKMFV